MNISDLFIRRPVLSTVLAFLILLVGLQGIFNLAVREYPEVEETAITITTVYPGASPDLVQGFISSPISAAVATTENIDYVTSQSMPSTSIVTVHMRLGSNPDVALTEVLSKVQQVRGDLPQDAKDPAIVKGTGRSFAIMYLAMQNPKMTSEQLTEYIKRVIRPRLSTVRGVAEVQILGAANFTMRIWIDPIRLAAHNITAADVLNAINTSNYLSAPGKTENEYVAYSITVQSTLQNEEAFGALPVKSEDGRVVRLRDVAEVELGAESNDTIVNINGQPGIFLGIYQTPAANPLNTAAAVEDELPAIQASLPEGMTINLIYDATDQISASIREVFQTITEAVVIVVIVILLFLGSFRSVLMPVVTIPLSLIGVCFLLWMMGYSLNLLSLLAMVLAIGLVVDDAIVVVENIHRHIEEGLSPLQASFVGMRDISSAVIAMTITLAAVFAPLAFTGGLTGALFREFALTLAGAVIISGIVALTITPMMSARLLKAGKPNRFAAFVDRTFDRLANRYERLVAGSLNYRPVTLMIVLALAALTGFLFLKTSSELAPEEDSGALFSLINAPRYATSRYTDLYADQIRDLTSDIPEVEANFQIVGFQGPTNSAIALWAFKDWSDRERSQKELQADIQGRLSKVAGVEAFVFSPPSLPGSGGGLPISLVIQSTGDPSQVYEIAEQIKQKAQASGRFIVVQNSMSYDAPQVRVTIDRDRAAALNLPISDIGTTLGLLVGGGSVARFDRDSNSYDVILQVPQRYRNNPARLGQFFVRNVKGDMVPLSAVVSVSTGASPAAIEQFNQLNSATISALPLPGVTTGDGLKVIEDIARPLLPAGFFIDYTGQSRLEKTEGNTILIAFILAVVVIYLVLAAQFESFRDPLIILMSVPLSIFGAIVPLNIGLGTLNIYTQVGLITLVGLITKHGILLVEFANQQRREHGLSVKDAIVASAKVRLRPILMTTAAMALGVVPLIIAEGAGAAARYSMGLVIFTGILIGTMFTLFVVPMFYTYISRRELKPIVEAPQRGSETNAGEQAVQPR
jgi:multidrug efflux pump